ncbi:MAG: hypothetical protein K9M51_03175 [Candidatus Gracilibacteria bacterium]|nr:hypothetical protein [Candidatus Gracilibacteria bacterium]
MKQTCAVSGEPFEIPQKAQKFYEQMEVPVPNVSPRELLRELMALRNEWHLYRRKCDSTGETIISAYPPDTPFPVYKNEIWWGDSWDGLDFGQAVDFDRSFFEQFLDLIRSVPREGTSVFNSQNCDYNSHTRESKNCYLCSLTYRVEDCFHASWLVNAKNIVDSWRIIDSELCYECINCTNCFECVMLQEGSACNNCFFSYQLRGCDHCIGCSNLSHKSYYVRNKKVTPEEFAREKEKYLNGTFSAWEKGMTLFEQVKKEAPHRFVHNLHCENVRGDLLQHCRNCWNAFDGVESEDCGQNVSFDKSKDIWNCFSTGWPGCELCYRSAVIRRSTDIRCSYYIWFSHRMTYCDSCISCSDCLGCVGLKHKKYCILNQQYTKEEYEELSKKIIQKLKEENLWGTLPPNWSTFAYNESAADYYFPLSQKEVESRGLRWKAMEDAQDRSNFTPPDSIDAVGDDVVEKILKCEQAGKNYTIQKGELAFYRQLNLPLPRVCPWVRVQRRWDRKNPFELWSRECDACGVSIVSSFAPDHPERVLCEQCYLQTVNGKLQITNYKLQMRKSPRPPLKRGGVKREKFGKKEIQICVPYKKDRLSLKKGKENGKVLPKSVLSFWSPD